MPNFGKIWAPQETQSVTGKIRGAVKPQGALEPRIQMAVGKLQIQITKLDGMLAKFQERDARLMQRIVETMQRHDANASRVLASELAEIRKVTKMLSSSRMSLEQVQTRLRTIHDFGSAMVAMGPAMSTMKELKPSLGKFMPEADGELKNIMETMGGFTGDVIGGDFPPDQGQDIDAATESILKEASAVAGEQVGEKFPTVPSPAGFQSESTPTYE